MSKRAIILAGGLGTRLRPYTTVLPKPLMPIGDYPILEIVIRQLIRAGFDHITLAVNYQANIIKAFFQDGRSWGARIDYLLEDTPLGTIGPLKLISDLPENFLVMNGDVLTDFDFAFFYDWHVRSGNIFTISSIHREDKIDYGVLDVNDIDVLTRFREKPKVTYQVCMGINMLSRDVLPLIPEKRLYGFDNLVWDFLAANMPVAVRAFDGYWLDIGRPEDYEKAIDEFELFKSKLLYD